MVMEYVEGKGVGFGFVGTLLADFYYTEGGLKLKRCKGFMRPLLLCLPFLFRCQASEGMLDQVMTTTLFSLFSLAPIS